MSEYPHMCRDGHEEIGFYDSEIEPCPVCDVMGQLGAARAEIRGMRDRLLIASMQLSDLDPEGEQATKFQVLRAEIESVRAAYEGLIAEAVSALRDDPLDDRPLMVLVVAAIAARENAERELARVRPVMLAIGKASALCSKTMSAEDVREYERKIMDAVLAFRALAAKEVIGIDVLGPGIVDVNGVEIVEWTEARARAKEVK